jgi:hypothetical protein
MDDAMLGWLTLGGVVFALFLLSLSVRLCMDVHAIRQHMDRDRVNH